MPGPPQRGERSRRREAQPRARSVLTLSKLGVRDRTRDVRKAFERKLA